MDCYDQVTDKWTSLSAPRQRRYNHCAVALNGYLYVIGGEPKITIFIKYSRSSKPATYLNSIRSNCTLRSRVGVVLGKHVAFQISVLGLICAHDFTGFSPGSLLKVNYAF